MVEEIQERVLSVISEQQGGIEVTPADTLEHLGLDSLDLIELVMELESSLGDIVIDDLQVEAWITCQDIIKTCEAIAAKV